MAQLFNSTGSMKPRTAIMSATQKQNFAAFTGLAQNRRDTGDGQQVIIGGSEMYVSDFGNIKFQASVFCSTRDCLIYDESMIAVATLNAMKTVELAKNGAAEKRMIVCDKALVVRNEAALAVIADLA